MNTGKQNSVPLCANVTSLEILSFFSVWEASEFTKLEDIYNLQWKSTGDFLCSKCNNKKYQRRETSGIY